MFMQDKNGNTIRKGDTVKIEGGFFDADWSGGDYCLQKVNKKGELSQAKYNLAFWPLMVTTNSREKRREAKAHNAAHATIEIIKADEY